MILKLKYAASCLSPIVIDQIAEVSPVAGPYFMIPGKHVKWEIHTFLHGAEDRMGAGLILEEDCTFYDGDLSPEDFEDENPVRVAVRSLKLDLRNGETRHIYYPTEFFDVFLMSDEGKTIDRLPK